LGLSGSTSASSAAYKNNACAREVRKVSTCRGGAEHGGGGEDRFEIPAPISASARPSQLTSAAKGGILYSKGVRLTNGERHHQ
jgi:hypothetical protein